MPAGHRTVVADAGEYARVKAKRLASGDQGLVHQLRRRSALQRELAELPDERVAALRVATRARFTSSAVGAPCSASWLSCLTSESPRCRSSRVAIIMSTLRARLTISSRPGGSCPSGRRIEVSPRPTASTARCTRRVRRRTPRYRAERTKTESTTIAIVPTVASVPVIDWVAAAAADFELVMNTAPKTASPTIKGWTVTRYWRWLWSVVA